MRRLGITLAGALSLVAIMSACATSVEDPVLDGTGDTSSATPSEDDGAKLPPPSTSETDDDAGTTSSSSSSSSGGTDSGAPIDTDSGTSTSSSSSSSGGTGVACDISDAVAAAYYTYQAGQQAAPVPCPCAAGDCCYLGVTCVDEL